MLHQSCHNSSCKIHVKVVHNLCAISVLSIVHLSIHQKIVKNYSFYMYIAYII